ncbi:ABC transporter ATP-binding protein/permease [Neisseria sp. ZJ106]|uniref:ABC transporter ATP-binding protein/permease n=1 Tax=Neisseria lisongii TaxID=2912188 RepID=A0ABY7RHP9_9NEIS|nr:ABC transporter ATP-binding protein/permease [Neisseria lisongii]MCF7520740.1 ABC transporter ATP-binding protein/permease [Neisseria lisongii]WCL70683.1 ABC transporter ATP-binding protein/permease [Neisseria lisongii]
MQKWQIELYGTPLWLLQTLAGVCLTAAVILFLVSKTRFGKEFAYLSGLCLTPKGRLKIGFAIIGMTVLLLTEVRLNVLSTFMSNGLYSSMQDLNLQAFWQFAAMNAGVVLLRTFNGVINDFLDQSFAIKWSQRLNSVLVERWLAQKNYYRLHMLRHEPDNIDQRIQQDAQDFIKSTIEFIRGMLNSVVSSLEFAFVLWGLAGILTMFGVNIPHGMVWFVFIFVILATFIAMWIGNPLIRFNYENEKLNGDYRYSLIRLRDHAESIAFYGGEQHEQQQLNARFSDIVRNRWRIARQSVGLSGFNDMFSNAIQLLPIILQAPRLFAGQIKIGDVQQTVQAFARLQKALSFFRMFYESFTAYRARLERLHGFLRRTETPHEPRKLNIRPISDGLRLHNVTLYRNNGEILISNISTELKTGSSLLIKGPSGCGKTSLLRAMAGLWPFGCTGTLYIPPHSEILFVPQRPYMPQGSLRHAICYPNICEQHPALTDTLRQCRLEHLIDKLDRHDDWQQKLSPGELQRIAFCRSLLTPAKVFLFDETTSALDEPTEALLYQLMRAKHPDSMIISIGHRSSLNPFHTQHLDIGQTTCS